MNPLLRTVPALLLMLAMPAVSAEPPQTASEDPAHQELRKLRDGLLDAMNRGDIDAALRFLHTNCVITWHNAEVSRGHLGVRAYNDRVMKGPNRIVDTFHCDVHVDELSILYHGDTAICFGSSDEQFKLANGRNLNVKGRWSATLVKEDGRWLVASLHASTNLFDNVMLDLAKKAGAVATAVCLVAGLGIGWLIGRRGKRSPHVK